jgi:hypothetical protein
MEELNFEQRCTIKFFVELGETGIETFNKLKHAYEEHALSRSQAFKWYKAFSEGRESMKDEPRSGRPCLYYVRFTASFKASSAHTAIFCFLFHFPVTSILFMISQ